METINAYTLNKPETKLLKCKIRTQPPVCLPYHRYLT